MFRVLAFMAVLTPLTVLAAPGDFWGPIVPKCGLDVSAFMCQACHLAALTHNILAFFISAAVGAAAVMFAYAGFLYVSASSNHGNIDKAKGIFSQVLIGLVLVLVAWLVVDLTLRVFTNQSLQVLTQFQCVKAELVNGSFTFPETPVEVAVTTAPSASCTTNPITHDAAMAKFQGKIKVTSSAGSGPANVNSTCSGYGCTNLSGVCSTTVDKLLSINDELIKAGCGSLEITGGTERRVHLTAAQGGQHETGLAFDVAENECAGRWIQKNGAKYGITQFCTTPKMAAKGFGFGGCAGHEPASQPHFHFGF